MSSNFNYSLDSANYTWSNALLWGNCIGHYKATYNEQGIKRIVHLTIALIETCPIISQIASIAEKIIINYYTTPIRTPTPAPNLATPVATAKSTTSLTRNQVSQYHKDLAASVKESPFFCWSKWSDAQIMPSIAGLTHLAANLTKKHRFQEGKLSVCSTLAAFKTKLNIIQSFFNQSENFRIAFVVPTHSTSWGTNEKGVAPKRSEEFMQHVIAIGVEKMGNRLHVTLLDPMIRHLNDRIRIPNVGLGPEMENVPFTEQEKVLSYIVTSTLDPRTTMLYHSDVLREQSNCCWTFALKDAVSFLESPSFFRDIRTTTECLDKQGTRDFFRFELRTIKALPAAFMKTAQLSEPEFNLYFKQNPDQDNESIRKKLAKHRVEGMNLRIEHKAVQWLEQLKHAS